MLASEKEILEVNKPRTINFIKCNEHHIPKNNNDVKHTVQTLKAFNSADGLKSRNNHKLSRNGEDDFVLKLLNENNNNVWSLDVYHRNGKNGGKRLLYKPEGAFAFILALFYDDH